MEPCRFDMRCWRPLCPFRHSVRRAARWIAVWRLPGEQEDELHERIVEQNVDMPVPEITVPVPFQKEIVEVVKFFPAERISERTIEQVVDASVPQILEEDVEVVKVDSTAHLVPQDRISERICEQIVDATIPQAVDVPVPPFQEGIVELIKPFPAERIPERTVEHIVDIPVPQIQKQTVEVAKTTPQERFSERTVVQTEDVPVPQTLNEIVEVVKAVTTAHQAVHEPSFPSFQEKIDEMIKLFPEERVPKRIIHGFTPQERSSERIHEQIADQPSDQARRDFADLLHFDMNECNSEPSRMWPQSKIHLRSVFLGGLMNRSTSPLLPTLCLRS